MTPNNPSLKTAPASGPASTVVPLLALLGSVTALGVGTSLAKQLFPQVGSLGTTALRVGLSALLVLAIPQRLAARLPPAEKTRLGKNAESVVMFFNPQRPTLLCTQIPPAFTPLPGGSVY